jgi:hypothetical protein
MGSSPELTAPSARRGFSFPRGTLAVAVRPSCFARAPAAGDSISAFKAAASALGVKTFDMPFTTPLNSKTHLMVLQPRLAAASLWPRRRHSHSRQSAIDPAAGNATPAARDPQGSRLPQGGLTSYGSDFEDPASASRSLREPYSPRTASGRSAGPVIQPSLKWSLT